MQKFGVSILVLYRYYVAVRNFHPFLTIGSRVSVSKLGSLRSGPTVCAKNDLIKVIFLSMIWLDFLLITFFLVENSSETMQLDFSS